MKRLLVLLAGFLPVSAAQAQDPAQRWMVDATPDRAVALTYGWPDSEHVVRFVCAPTSGLIDFSISVRAKLPRKPSIRIELRSGSKVADITGDAFTDETTVDRAFISGRIPSRSQVMAAFSASGRIETKTLGQTVTPPLAEKALLGRFFKVCDAA